MPESRDAGEGVRVPSVAGEVLTFMRAVGAEVYSPEYLGALVLSGPPSEVQDDVRDGVSWSYQRCDATGVVYQARGREVVGVLIPLVADDGSATYPAAGSLIDGLVLPARREQVVAFLGEPRRSSQYMDLYLVNDRYLRFDVTDGETTALSVVSTGVSA